MLKADKKKTADREEGRNIADSCQSFCCFSRRILSVTPGARIRIRTKSQQDRVPPISSMLMPWATISCCSGSSHCSALCNYTVHNRTLSCSFFLRYFLLHFPPFLVFTGCFLLLNACFVDRGPAGGEGCVRTAVFETLLFRSTLFIRFICFVPLTTFFFYCSIMIALPGLSLFHRQPRFSQFKSKQNAAYPATSIRIIYLHYR